jgi:hypothetical protein
MEPNPYLLANFSGLLAAWNNLTVNIDGRHPGGYIRSVGSKLILCYPAACFGSCILGTIKPSFFLLLLRQGENLRVPTYEEKLSRQKRGALQIGNWKDDEWLKNHDNLYTK